MSSESFSDFLAGVVEKVSKKVEGAGEGGSAQ